MLLDHGATGNMRHHIVGAQQTLCHSIVVNTRHALTGLAVTAATTSDAPVAPPAINGRIFADNAFQTVRVCPPCYNARAKALPIKPSPRTEISLMIVTPLR